MMVKLSNEGSIIEVLERPALKRSVGEHPLSNGVKQITLTGLNSAPIVKGNGGSVQITADDVQASLQHAVLRSNGQSVRVEIGRDRAPASSH